MNLSDIIHMEIEVEEESSLVGFCVLGGIFSGGDRFKGGQPDRRADCRNRTAAGLHGTGDYSGIFRWKSGENGFDYAYR